MAYSTSFYPKAFCRRAVHLWKSKDDDTPRAFLIKLRNAQQIEELSHHCGECGSHTMISQKGCAKCTNEEPDPVMPSVAEVMRDIPEDDEGDAEPSSLQKLMRVHRNLGHPPNRLLAQSLKEAKAPASVVDLASQLQCPLCARHVRTSPARPANPLRARE